MLTRTRCLVITLTLTISATAFGAVWVDTHGEQATVDLRWPAGFVDLVDDDQRAFGYFFEWSHHPDSRTHSFHYDGDVAALNDFLQRYAELEDTVLQVLLYPGHMRRSPLEQSLLPDDIQVDWGLRAWRTPELRRKAGDPPYWTHLDIYLGGDIRLEDLHVPISVPVHATSGSGEGIEDFAKRHREAREANQTCCSRSG